MEDGDEVGGGRCQVFPFGELKINDELSLSYHVNKITIDKKKIRIALIFGRFHLLLFSYVRWNNGERKISSCCQRALD